MDGRLNLILKICMPRKRTCNMKLLIRFDTINGFRNLYDAINDVAIKDIALD